MAEDPATEAEFLGLTDAAGEEIRLHPLLSNAEVLDARARARAKIEKERRTAAMKAVEDEETKRLRLEEGLTSGSTVGDEMVCITLNLAPHSSCIRTNGTEGMTYWHGFPYTVPRHVAASLMETQARGWWHQDEIDGKNRLQHYQHARDTGVSPVTGTVNAPISPGIVVRPEAVH